MKWSTVYCYVLEYGPLSNKILHENDYTGIISTLREISANQKQPSDVVAPDSVGGDTIEKIIKNTTTTILQVQLL